MMQGTCRDKATLCRIKTKESRRKGKKVVDKKLEAVQKFKKNIEKLSPAEIDELNKEAIKALTIKHN